RIDDREHLGTEVDAQLAYLCDGAEAARGVGRPLPDVQLCRSAEAPSQLFGCEAPAEARADDEDAIRLLVHVAVAARCVTVALRALTARANAIILMCLRLRRTHSSRGSCAFVVARSASPADLCWLTNCAECRRAIFGSLRRSAPRARSADARQRLLAPRCCRAWLESCT
ncbi:unnamed protein product, partial [Pelagomonas calceolata]